MRLFPALLALLLLPACASGGSGGFPSPTTRELWVDLTFGTEVNPDRFEYFLVFNFDTDANQKPQIDPDGFENRDVIGRGWDTYYVYGTPGHAPVNFYKGRGGTDAHGDPVTDSGGFPEILKVPLLANGPEVIFTGTVSKSPDGNAPAVRNNTIRWRFELGRFPSTPGQLNDPAKFRLGILVSDRSIDELENPDDGDAQDVVMYERFFETAVAIDVAQRQDYSERSDPQEFVEEVKVNNVPSLTGPFAAADLITWEVQIVTN